MDYATFDVQKGNVVTPTISANLDVMVHYAASMIAPHFGLEIGRLKLPRTVLNKRALHYGKENTLSFTQRSLEDRNNTTLGHEVSHNLHYRVNPKIFETHRHDMEARNLVELVACYGAHLFSSTEHPEILQAKQSIAEEIKQLDVQDLELLKKPNSSEEYIIWDEEIHRGGELAANFLYSKFNAKYLNEFALGDVDTAKALLTKSGYNAPLFLPYNPKIIYSVNDDGELILTKILIIDDIAQSRHKLNMTIESIVSQD